MHRLFVAVRPPAPVRAQILGLMGGVAGARWQSDDQLHLTLRFIGEVDRWVAEEVALALSAVRHPPFHVALNGLGAFDRKGRSDALWVGVTPHGELAALHRKIDQALVRLGLPPEGRAYLPHITIARFGRSAGPVSGFAESHANVASAPFAVEHLILFESHVGHEGASYEAVERYALG